MKSAELELLGVLKKLKGPVAAEAVLGTVHKSTELEVQNLRNWKWTVSVEEAMGSGYNKAHHVFPNLKSG